MNSGCYMHITSHHYLQSVLQNHCIYKLDAVNNEWCMIIKTKGALSGRQGNY